MNNPKIKNSSKKVRLRQKDPEKQAGAVMLPRTYKKEQMQIFRCKPALLYLGTQGISEVFVSHQIHLDISY